MSRYGEIKRVASIPLDRRIIRQVEKSGSTLDYISGTIVYDLMTEAFGPLFSVEFSEPKRVRYDRLQYWDKKANTYKDYTPSEIVEVKATITVPIKDPETDSVVYVKREGFGTAVMKKSFEEMVLKTAGTDAFKKAAYSFGIAGELFRDENEQEFYNDVIRKVWTKPRIQQFQAEFQFLKKYMQDNNLGKDIDTPAQIAFRNEYARLTSSNIKQVCTILANQAEKTEGGAA